MKLRLILSLLSVLLFFACANENEQVSDDTNSTEFNLEELEKSDQEKADSVEKYWKDKMEKHK